MHGGERFLECSMCTSKFVKASSWNVFYVWINDYFVKQQTTWPSGLSSDMHDSNVRPHFLFWFISIISLSCLFPSLVQLSHPGCCLCVIYYFPSKFPYSSMSTVENKQTLISMCDPLVVNRLISTWVQCENGFHRDGRGRWAHRLPYWGL